MEQSRLKYLFGKYFDKTATPEEREEFADLITIESNREAVMQLFANAWENYEEESNLLTDETADHMLDLILRTPSPNFIMESHMDGEANGDKDEDISSGPTRYRIGFGFRLAAAAAVLVLVVGGYLLRHRSSPVENSTAARRMGSDVNPGRFKASLVLGDGRRIVLDSAGPGKLAEQGNTAVMNKGGQVVYQAGAKDTGATMVNSIATGKGETFAFTLADGSRIWLNSASSVRFPVAFPGKERRIEVSGEAYVQVAKNPAKSFIVSVGGLEIQALGTEFNINAYTDEDRINTTLINGAVRVARGSENILLKPGQQSGLDNNGRLSEPKEVDIEEITSWKEGNFQFESADIKTILRELARWYDVEVVYEGPLKEKKFFGIISRNSTLSNVLEMLKASDIQFRIEGKKLYVRSV